MTSQLRSVKKWKYDVFLNFLPEDFNENFVTDLYKRLEDTGIKTFKHDGRYAKLAPFSTEISEAIEESRIAITIFSKMYAFSTRCSEEITKIMECVDNHGQEFFPVCCTEPSAVLHMFNIKRYQAYSEGSDREKVRRWKDALIKAFVIAGFNKYVYNYSYPLGVFCW